MCRCRGRALLFKPDCLDKAVGMPAVQIPIGRHTELMKDLDALMLSQGIERWERLKDVVAAHQPCKDHTGRGNMQL